ncbi:hypothetical protein WUBG_06202 [Wuchereria bancrofti]|nr:hypothetical protein WUBG_06202 [Wuchereria bancrofti]
MQYIPLFYGYFANEGIYLNRIKKEKLLGEIPIGQLLVRKSELSGRINSKTDDQMQKKGLGSSGCPSRESTNINSEATSNMDAELFSSVGLYDLLTRKSDEEKN